MHLIFISYPFVFIVSNMIRKHMIWLNIALFSSKIVAYDANKFLRCGAATSSIHHKQYDVHLFVFYAYF